MNFKRVIPICLILLFCNVACQATSSLEATVTPLPQATPTFEPARDFTLQTLAGEAITLSDLRGQWVLLNFWATWCPPCVAEMPYLQRLADDSNIAVLGVNFHESPAAVNRFLTDHAITFPILMNPDQVTIIFYQARSLPRTILINPDGLIALRIIGPIDEAHLDAWLDERGL